VTVRQGTTGGELFSLLCGATLILFVIKQEIGHAFSADRSLAFTITIRNVTVLSNPAFSGAIAFVIPIPPKIEEIHYLFIAF